MHFIKDSSTTLFVSCIFAGLLILISGVSCYLHVFLKLRKNEPALFRQTKDSFTILISLILSFVLGYSAVIISMIFHYEFDFNAIFGPILFLGSLFVVSTAYLNIRMFNKLLKSREILKNQAFQDFTTKLPNRRFLTDKIKRAQLQKKQNPDFEFNVVFIDILNFKRVNDSFGHYTGDKILTQAANRLLKFTSKYNTPSRIGGDDFVLLLEKSSPSDGVKCLKKLRHSLQQTYDIDGVKFNLDISYGMYIATNENISPSDIIGRANTAMRRSKQRGKNRFSVYTESLKHSDYDALLFENDFKRALKDAEFELVFQPQYNLDQNLTLAGFEALVRWRHPEKGSISPGDFIPIAEETGLIIELDRYVLDKACRIWADCLSESNKCSDIHISVNISAVHMAESSLVRFVDETVSKYDIPPETLVLELTESAFIIEPTLAAAKLHALNDLGVTCAIDDFGTGYSSLAYLSTFPTQSIKIDKSFIAEINSDRNARKLVESVINLAHGLKMKAVAEGVETEEQLDVLRTLGCDMVQGFFLTKPLPLGSTRSMIDDHFSSKNN